MALITGYLMIGIPIGFLFAANELNDRELHKLKIHDSRTHRSYSCQICSDARDGFKPFVVGAVMTLFWLPFLWFWATDQVLTRTTRAVAKHIPSGRELQRLRDEKVIERSRKERDRNINSIERDLQWSGGGIVKETPLRYNYNDHGNYARSLRGVRRKLPPN